MRRAAISHLAVAAAFGALALALLYPGVLTGRAVGDDASVLRVWPMTELGVAPPAHTNPFLYDATYVFHPDLAWARSRVRDLTPPLWNPYNTEGFPQLASQQTALLYPLTLLSYLLPFWWSIGLIEALKLLIGAFGTFLFARSLGLSRAPAAFSAVSFGFCTYEISWLSHPHSNVYVLLPWLLLAIDAAAHRGRRRDIGLVALAWGTALLGGQPESVFICGLLAAPFAVWRLWEVDERARRAAVIAGGIALGTLAGAVVLLPFLELLNASYASARGSDHGLQIKTLVALALPEVWGRPDRAYDAVQQANYLERTVYVGALPALLAATAVLRWPRGPVRFFAPAAAVAAVFAYELPAISHAALNLPVFDDVAMTRACIVVSFCLAILGGLGLQALLERDERAVRIALVLVAVALVVPLAGLLAVGEARSQLPHLRGAMPLLGGSADSAGAAEAASILRWLLFAAAGGLLLLIAVRVPRLVAVAAVAAVALTAFDLVNLGRGFYPTFDPAGLDRTPPSVALAARGAGHDRIAVGEEAFIPNLAVRYDVRDVRGHGLPQVRRVGRLYADLGGVGGHIKLVDYTPGWPKLLGTFAAPRLVGTPPVAPGVEPERAGARISDVEALPRAYVTTGWRPASGEDEALRLTLDSSLADLGERPVIEGAPAAPVGSDLPRTAAFVRDGDLDVTVRVDAPNGGWLVLGDTYFPGWKASVDGRSAEIHAANGAFRAVRLPPGARTVSFAYRPLSVIAGAILSLLAWLAIAVLIVRRAA